LTNHHNNTARIRRYSPNPAPAIHPTPRQQSHNKNNNKNNNNNNYNNHHHHHHNHHHRAILARTI
jgi:hypothetical protein